MARIRNSRSRRAQKAPALPRKSPRQARSGATVAAILDATARVLAREGFDRASTNRIAAAAGVSVGSLYQYFPNKEALVGALIDRYREASMAGVLGRLEGLRSAPLREAIRELVAATVAVHAHDPVLRRTLAEEVPRTGRLKRLLEDLDVVGARLVATLLEVRREELRHADVHRAAFVVVHAAGSVVQRAMLDRRLGREETIEEVTDLCVRYLLP